MAARLLKKRRDGWAVPLDGWRVNRIEFDFQVHLAFLSEEPPFTASMYLTLECPFNLSLRDDELELDPEGPHEALSPVLGLLQRTVDEAFVEKDGSLRLAFREGGHVRCEPHPQFEAWQLNRPDGAMVVCMPGGELAIWDAAETERSRS